MKLYRNAIILVVVLGLLVGAYYFISNQKDKANEDIAEDTTDKTITVIDVEQDKINLLEFNNESGKFSLKKQGEEWVMDPVPEFPILSATVDSSASSVSVITADKVIEENATDLAKYGLDKPTTIKVGLSDGSSKELEIGSNSPTNDGVYVKNKGEAKVYLISSYYADSFKKTRNDFIKKDILPVEANTLKTFSYEKNGEMQYAINVDAEGKMQITSPITEEGDSAKIGPMLSAVVQLTVKDLVDENPTDLAKYGLDKPAYALTYGDDKTTKKILFGKEVEKGTVAYAMFPEGKSVFTIDITPLTFLDVKLNDILNVFIYLPNIKDVSKVELFIDGKKIVSEITTDEENKDNDKFKVNGKDANMENEKGSSLFRAFYQAMIGVTMNKYEPGAQPSGTPEITIKYYMKTDSKVVTVDYIPKDSNYYYAMKDGVYTDRVVLKSKFDEPDSIRATYKALEDAMAKE